MTRVGLSVLLLLVAFSPACAGERGLIEQVAEGRARLPRAIVRVLERPSRLELIALDEPAAFPRHLRAFPRSSIRARFALTDPGQQRSLVRALYRAVGRGSYVGLCFHPHHALHAARGRDALVLAICLQCAQLAYETADGPLRYVALDPRVLAPALDQLFAPRGLRFDPARPYFGGWS